MALWPLGPQGNSLVFSQEAQPPAPWPVHPLALGSSRPAPCQGQPEATGWKQGCGSPHAFDGRSPCPVPQHSLILIHPLFHVRHGLLFPLQRDSPVARGPAARLCGKRRACHPPALDQLHCAHAPVGQRRHPSRARLQAPHPLDVALSLQQPGLSPGSGLATGRNLQDQPTPWAKLRAHGHREGPLPAALSVKLSGQTRRTDQGHGACGGRRDTRGTRRGHAAAEMPRAILLAAPQTHR